MLFEKGGEEGLRECKGEVNLIIVPIYGNTTVKLLYVISVCHGEVVQ
jgi:hypothetical protein